MYWEEWWRAVHHCLQETLGPESPCHTEEEPDPTLGSASERLFRSKAAAEAKCGRPPSHPRPIQTAEQWGPASDRAQGTQHSLISN